MVFDRVIFNVLVMLFVIGSIWLFMRIKFNKRYTLRDQFLEKEREANTARSNKVETEYFFTPDTSVLPFNESAEGDVAEAQSKVLRVAEATMIRFPEKRSNLELKSAYGVVNLETVTGYEENYNRYIEALVSWAEALLGQENKEDAVKVLEHTVELGSDYRKTYMHLADYYTDAKKLDALLDRVAEYFIDEGIKRQIVQYIMDRKERL